MLIFLGDFGEEDFVELIPLFAGKVLTDHLLAEALQI